VATSGPHVVDGDELGISLVEDPEFGLVSEWVDGLDSLQSAMSDSKIVKK
jgi:hypothetical protein